MARRNVRSTVGSDGVKVVVHIHLCETFETQSLKNAGKTMAGAGVLGRHFQWSCYSLYCSTGSCKESAWIQLFDLFVILHVPLTEYLQQRTNVVTSYHQACLQEQVGSGRVTACARTPSAPPPSSPAFTSVHSNIGYTREQTGIGVSWLSGSRAA